MHECNPVCSASKALLVFIVMLVMTLAGLAQNHRPLVGEKKPLLPLSKKVEITPPLQESPDVKFYVEVNEVRKTGSISYHCLKGWVFVKDQESRGQEIVVQLERPDGSFVHYSTELNERLDIRNHFKNPLYSFSGFTALIWLEDEANLDVCTIRLIARNQNGIYKSSAWKAGIRFSLRTEIEVPIPESHDVIFNVETNEKRSNGKTEYHYLFGWAFVNDQDSKGQQIYVQLQNPDGASIQYLAQMVGRPDIQVYLKNPFSYFSGFIAIIPLREDADITAGTIRLLVRNASGIHKSCSWKVGIKFSSPFELDLQGHEHRGIHLFLDSSEELVKGASVYRRLTGWFYVNGSDNGVDEVYLRFEKPNGIATIFSTCLTERPDVAIGFNVPFAKSFGFDVTFPIEASLDFNACKTRLVLKNKNKMLISPEWKPWRKAGPPACRLTLFVMTNWILVVLTALALSFFIWQDRSLLVKPSIMAILFFHLMCQWGTAFKGARIEQFLPNPWIIVLLSHGFPLIGLMVSLFIGRRSAREMWARIPINEAADLKNRIWAWAILALCLAGFIAIYLFHVPFRSTGLYTIFTSPRDSGLARDMSVKFLDNAFFRYGHNIIMAVVASLLAVLTLQLLIAYGKKRKWPQSLMFLASLVMIFIAASISGARSYSAGIVMVIFFAWLLRRSFPLRPAYLVVIALLILTFPTLLSLLREGEAVTAKKFFSYLRGSTLNRVAIIPMETGLYHVQYAQQHGPFGVRAMPKLATAMGIEPLNVPNFIGKWMDGSPLSTTTANTAYVYAYYSYFGLIAFIPCLIGLWLLDLCLFVYHRLSNTMLIPCVASVAIGVNIFSSVEYTVGLFTFGILLLPLVSWAVDRAVPKIELAVKKRIH